jgi:predicted unusual protein kinase regulating ubiquinone biosynthesis (AarF/ABC1/UbiB family)/nucleotide-binding universal stress UspA family protein
MVKRILVATDESPTAAHAVEWAAETAHRYGAELLLVSVLVPENLVGSLEEETAAKGLRLTELAQTLAGARGRALVVSDSDPATAIVRAAEEEAADMLVVGNVGMGDRKEFLLGNLPNRVSHNARCSVVIVNTSRPAADGAAKATRERRFEAEEGPSEGRLLGRAARIGRVMAKFGLREVVGVHRGGAASTASAAKGFRDALEELGPTFAKLGQILSTRPDLLPPAFVEQLATLQDRVKPLTEAEVVGVMEQELQVPWEDVFESIEPDPMAAGTIAQVHRAVLAGGDRVVVKVQRPNAEAEILQDLGLLDEFARHAANRPVFRQVVDLPAMIEHLSEALRRELDFRQEAANIERMRQVLAPFPRLDVPRLYDHVLTARLLVMEEVQGIPVRQAPMGEARKEAARQLLESYYRQVLTEGFFHADPHPGNLMWWNDKIYFLDFGMVGEIDAATKELLMLLLLAFWQEDTSFLADTLLMLAGGDRHPNLDLEAFQKELSEVIARYRHASLREFRLGPMLEELTEISLRHEVRMPPSLALAAKAFGQMQLATAELDPSLDPFSVAGSFFFKQLTDRAREVASPRRMVYEGQKLAVRLTRIMEGLERALGTRSGPSLRVDFHGTERLEAVIRRAGRRLALAVAGGSAILGATIAAASTRLVVWVPAGLGALGAVFIVALLLDLVRSRDLPPDA